MSFDPNTGQPIAAPAPKFDPNTGQPIAAPAPKFDPNTGQPIAAPGVEVMMPAPVVAQPGAVMTPEQMQMMQMQMMQNQGPPGAPPGGSNVNIKYCGFVTCLLFIVGVPCVCFCPCDQMTLYKAPDGQLYDMAGTKAQTPPCGQVP